MPVAACSGTSRCDRSISISAVPGGNPAALADPEGYASVWTFCPSCKSYTCDRCLSRQQGRCKCGAPARLYTEAERIQRANGGAPPPAPTAAPAAAPQSSGNPFAPSAGPVGGALPLRMLLEGIGGQIDADLGRGGADRARAMARLAATLMIQQGPDAPAPDVAWLMWFGESFYRWKFFAEGAEYWKGLNQTLKKLGKGDTDDSARAVAGASAFMILSGEVGPSAPHAANMAAYILKVYGPAHVLTKDAHAKLGMSPNSAPQPARSAWPAAAPAAAPAAPQVNLTPTRPKLPPEIANLDGTTQLALWVTLAFVDIAVADGELAEKEYLTWKQTIQRMQLPDVWDRYGAQGLKNMLHAGVLQQLSCEFALLPPDSRARLAGVLVEFMMADGKVDPGEVQAIKRIGGWLGVSLEIG